MHPKKLKSIKNRLISYYTFQAYSSEHHHSYKKTWQPALQRHTAS